MTRISERQTISDMERSCEDSVINPTMMDDLELVKDPTKIYLSLYEGITNIVLGKVDQC